MLNSLVIGSYISTLRKEKDLTQVELADKLNVSHQAVSKWERGESLPDIGTLYEISKVFGKSVDHILSGGKNERTPKRVGAIVEELAENHPERVANLMNNGEADVEGFVALAPILKTSTMRQVTDLVDKNKFTVDHLMQLAPFMEKDVLSSYAENIDKSLLTWEQILSLAPFLSGHTLKNITETIVESPTLKQIINIAPFYRRDSDLDGLIKQANLEEISWSDVQNLAPFVSADTLINLIEKSGNNSLTLDELINIAPFLDEHMDRLVEQATIESLTWDQIPNLAPFVNKETLGNLVGKIDDKEIDSSYLMDIAPFLGKEKLGELLENMHISNLTPSFIAEIAVFLKKETLTKLMNKLVG